MKKLFPNATPCVKKVTECYYREPDLSMIFIIIFFRTPLMDPKKLIRCGISRNMQDLSTYSWTGYSGIQRREESTPHRLINARLQESTETSKDVYGKDSGPPGGR